MHYASIGALPSALVQRSVQVCLRAPCIVDLSTRPATEPPRKQAHAQVQFWGSASGCTGTRTGIQVVSDQALGNFNPV